MNRIFTLTVACLLCALSSQAVLKTWIGASGASWSVASNWSPGVTPPGSADDVQFTGAALVTMDVNPNINSILVSAAGLVELSASAARTITLSSTSAITPGLKINAGATLKLSQSAASAFALALTGNAGVTGQIYGTLQFTGSNISAAARLDLFTGPLNNGTVTVFDGGIIQYDINTGNSIGNGLTGLIMEAGSQYIMLKNGGAVPPGNFKNGSLISIKGVTTSATSLSSSATYNGLIVWDCPSQTSTVSGSSANIMPSTSYTVDSLNIKSTGTGTVRLATNPTGFTIGHLQVDGGILELSAPGSSGRNGTVTTDFKITGGNVIGNATFAFDNIAPDSMRLTVNGNFIMNSGSFDLSNRPPALLSGGSFGMVVKGGVLQTGGTITASSSFSGLSPSRINYIQLQGTALQQLFLNNWTGPIQLIADNSNGVLLLSNVTCPDTLYLKSGYMQLDNNHIQVAASKFKTQVILPTPHFVTSGTGHVTLTSLASFATAVFPVSPMANSISSVILRNGDASANTFNVRVEVGNNPGGIFNTGLTVNRTWIINAANALSLSNPIDLTFLYPNTALNVLCNRSGAMELGHFVNPTWNLDPVGTTLVPRLGPGIITTDTTGPFAPNTLDSAFVLGNQFSILNLASGITLNYFKGNKRGSENMLNWAVNCTSNQAKFEIQRSGNGISFTSIANITASFNRCLQPFDFTDNNPLAGLNYYRIKIIDIDGSVTYSTFVLLQNKACAPGGMAMVPTLVNKPAAVICLDATAATALQFVVTDVNGRPVQTVKETAATGQNQFTINVEKLAPGLYYLSAYGSNQKWTTVRFVKL
jgi:hypothetical protein